MPVRPTSGSSRDAAQARLPILSRNAGSPRNTHRARPAGKASTTPVSIRTIFARRAATAGVAPGARIAGSTTGATQALQPGLTVGSRGAGQTAYSRDARPAWRAFRPRFFTDFTKLRFKRALVGNQLVDGVNGVLELNAEVEVLSAGEGLSTAQAVKKLG